MATDLVVQQPAVNPLAILQQAIDKGASLEQIVTLTQLVERWEDSIARKAFNVAFSEFKAEAVTIIKNADVKDGPLKGKKYVDLFGVVNAITPAMSKHGLSHSWKLTKDDKDWMEVTCTIRHILGYSESVSMGAAPDTGPGRNAIQARGSAKSYLERYTLLGAVGMAAADQDNDGNAILSEAVLNLVSDIAGAADIPALQDIYREAMKTTNKSAADKPKQEAYINAYNKRKAELEAA